MGLFQKLRWPGTTKKDAEEAREALADARTNLLNVERRETEVHSVADSLRKIRERNHFAESLEDLMLKPRRSS